MATEQLGKVVRLLNGINAKAPIILTEFTMFLSNVNSVVVKLKSYLLRLALFCDSLRDF